MLNEREKGKRKETSYHAVPTRLQSEGLSKGEGLLVVWLVRRGMKWGMKYERQEGDMWYGCSVV